MQIPKYMKCIAALLKYFSRAGDSQAFVAPVFFAREGAEEPFVPCTSFSSGGVKEDATAVTGSMPMEERYPWLCAMVP